LEFLICAPAAIFIPSLDYRKALFSVDVHQLPFWFSGSQSRDVPAVESFDFAATGVLCCLVYSQNNFLFLPILISSQGSCPDTDLVILKFSPCCREVHPGTCCWRNPDKHATRFPRSARVWSMNIRISRGLHIAIFHTVVNRYEQIHYTREEGLPTQSTARRLTDPQVRTQLLSHNSQWSSGEKSSFC
jgi:hypothetical protein